MKNAANLGMGSLVLSARGVSKTYDVDVKPPAIFVERLFGFKPAHKQFIALKPLDLDIELGRSIGILGKNGAGKSTLLGILSGIIPASTGKVTAFGRVAALVGVGQSFSIDETGRENARRFCRLQNMHGEELKEAIERIKEFSELGGHFDLPVKTYSSGMRARLNFACATSVKADLIIIDEVLAVGDAEFRSKCYGLIESSIERGQTYIMVSHSPAIIGNYCDRAIVLDHGEVKFDGDPLGAMQVYDSMLNVAARKRRSTEKLLEIRRRFAGEAANEEAVELTSVTLRDAASGVEIDGKAIVASETPLIVSAEYRVNQSVAQPRVSCGIRNGKGIMVAGIGEALRDEPWRAGETRRVEFSFIPRLSVGAYLVRLLVYDLSAGEKSTLLDREGTVEFHIVEGARTGLVDIGFRLASSQSVGSTTTDHARIAG